MDDYGVRTDIEYAKARLREAGDDHPYGAWRGGKASGGGGPASEKGKGTKEERRKEMADRVGAKNVGQQTSLSKRLGKEATAADASELASAEAFYGAGNMGKPGMSKRDQVKAFDALPDSADVWVYHATTTKQADAFAAGGLKSKDLPQNLARQQFAAGGDVTFAPGAGVGQGSYVGGTPFVVEGYGRSSVAMRVKKGSIKLPPEATHGGLSLGEALYFGDIGGLIPGNIPSSSIVRLRDTGRVPKDPFTELSP